MSGKNDPKFSGSADVSYERPYRRHSPSTGSSTGYPRYDAARAGTHHRDEYSRQEAWRTERPYYGRTPSPERYSHTTNFQMDSWGRATWRSPEGSSWKERRVPQGQDYEEVWSRSRREEAAAQPMFEPSDHWKQTHRMPAEYSENIEPPLREGREKSPEKYSPQQTYSPPYAPGERYRRYSPVRTYRSPYSYSGNERPQEPYTLPYDDRSSWPHLYYPQGMYVNGGFDNRPHEAERSTSYGTRPLPHQEYTDRAYLRERSVSAGPAYNAPLPSPIRTRTNLPDRRVSEGEPFLHSPVNFHSRKSSGSYSRGPQPFLRPRSPSPSPGPRAHYADEPQREWVPKQTDNDDSIASTPNDNVYQETREPTPLPVLEEPKVVLRSPEQAHSKEHPSPKSRHSATPEQSQQDASQITTSLAIQPSSTNPEKGQNETDPRASPPLSPPRNEGLITATAKLTLTVSHSRLSDGHITPSLERQEASPEPEIPLAVQLKRRGIVQSTPSIPPTPVEGQGAISREETVPPPPVPEPAEQPPPEPMPLSEALRVVVMMRLQHDRQTRGERVDPVLRANLARADPSPPVSSTPPDGLVREVVNGVKRRTTRENIFTQARPSLRVRFAQRQMDIDEKVKRCKEEYLVLHEQWVLHCQKLDEVARQLALQEAAATAGRTTRRSVATLGDAVRSDLEMEQIIASLGTEELTDATHLGARNAAVIPDMISVTGTTEFVYDNTNNLVHNPAEFYTPDTGTYDWTDEEIETFVEKFAEFPKQFGIIADFLPHKTAAQCVTFYYLHKHKHIDFRKVVANRVEKKKRGSRKKKSNALLADIRQHDDEMFATTSVARRRRAAAVPIPAPEPKKPIPIPRPNRALAQQEQAALTDTPTPEPEGELRKRKRRAARSYAVQDLLEPEGELEEAPDTDSKSTKRGRKPLSRRPRTSSITPASTPTTPFEVPPFATTSETRFIDQSELSVRRKTPANGSQWTEDDKSMFLHLLSHHGDDFKRIAASMPNKTTVQVSAYYKAHAMELGLHKLVESAPKRSPTPVTPGDTWSEPVFINSNGQPLGYFGIDPRVGSGSHNPASRVPVVDLALAQYGTAADLAQRSFVPAPFAGRPHQPHMFVNHITSPSPFATPAALTTTFPSMFPYTNLSPSHFTEAVVANGSRNGFRAHDGPVDPRAQHTKAFDTSASPMVVPQNWSRPPSQTPDDMIAYLEHRSRFNGHK